MVNPRGVDAPGPRALGVLDLDAIVDSTRCPVCRSLLAASTCGTCGADLTGTAARRVWDLSRQIVTAATERSAQVRVLDEEAAQRRAAHAARPVPPAAAASQPSAPSVPSAPSAPQAHVPSVPSPAGPPVFPPFVPPVAGGPAPGRRQGLGVQGVLVGLGALLLAVAALVFLAFAWNAMGIGGRAAVVGGVTLAALAGAAALRPRLEATGEAVGALAAVLVLADVWAVRRTGLLGADDVDALLYSGAGLAVAALVLGGWALRWRVRAGSVVASLVLPVAALLLGLATTGPQVTARGLGLGLVLAVLATAVRAWLPAAWSAERVLLRLAAAAGLVVLPVAALLTYTDDGNLGVALLAAGTVVAGLQATVELRAPVPAAVLPPAGAPAGPPAAAPPAAAPAAVAPVAAPVVVPVPALRRPATMRTLWSAVAGGYLATVAAVGAARVLDAVDAGTSPAYVVPVAAVGLVLVLVALAAPVLDRVGVRGRPAALAVEVVGGLVLSVEAILVGATVLAPAFAAASRPWEHGAGDSLSSVAPFTAGYADRPGLWQTVLVASCAALLVAAVALVVAHRVRPAVVGAEAPWTAPLLAGAGVVGLVCAPRLMVGAAVGALVVLAVLTTLVRLKVPALAGRSDAGPGARATALSLRFVAAGAGVLAVVDAWSVPALSVPLTVLGALALLAARPAVPAGAGPALVGTAAVAAAVAAGGAAGLLDRSVADRFTTAGVAAALLVVLAQSLAWAPPRPAAGAPGAPPTRGLLARLSTAERLAVTAAGAVVAVVALLAAAAGGGGADGGEPARLAVVLGALLLAAAVTALAPVRAAGPGGDPAVLPVVRGTRLTAAGAVPALVAATAVALVERFGDVTDGVVALRGLVLAAGAAAAALALAGLLAARRATVRDPRRPAVEAGVAVVALAAGIATLADPVAGRAWVTLMLLGAAASAVAVAADRRPVGWLAWVLLTASTWVRLDLGDVGTLEAYTLPPAAALLAVAALRVRRERGAAVWRVLAPGAGLALGPSVLASAGGGDLRPWVLLAVGAGLVTAGLLPDGGAPRAALLHRVGRVLTLAGAAAALGPGLLRTGAAVVGVLDDVRPGPSSLVRAAVVERWSLPAAAVVLAATLVLAVRHRAFTGRLAGLALVPALVVLAAPSWAAAAVVRWDGAPRLVAGDAATGPTVARLLGALAVLTVVAVVAAARRVPGAEAATPAGLLLTWPVALLTAAAAGLVAFTGYRVLDVPVEAFTVTSGALAVALGALRLRAVPALRSWPALGPGLLLALVPTLVLAADGALWRILGLVVVAAAVVAVGAARRLRAGVVVGAVVLVGHAVVQLAPYVADLTTSQWRWVVFAVVGAGLLALGATYERQLVRLRLARTRVSALR
ncbi:SCO7613 C-terminal domain-containing membrane protein [Kineosporia sp. A_224]|uniref:SCO7613 C-terminal domain-containing membrane protein n=1 Tax=Kineosporia sp. A_224 TaxID=1962180 RepID=UPI000B4A99A1|nr:DUF2157 domain-containing protein [Kineosporia sp. A_224]